ncbi:MAG: putative ABC transporter permease [Bacilli bacterium]|nr:putative ABC transporter permease [Bacilli bacterium]
MKEKYFRYIHNDIKFDKMTFIGIICLIIVIAGVFGFVYEFFFYYLNSGMKTFYYRGGNFLPWINIYATGSLMIFFITYRRRKNPLKVFLFSMVICGVLEYIAGWGLYHFGNGFRCWDYNTEILNFGNIDGYICLRSVLFFGLSSLLLIYVIVPFCFIVAKKMNKRAFLIISITLCSIIMADELYNLSIARIFDLPRASDIYKQLGFNYMKF